MSHRWHKFKIPWHQRSAYFDYYRICTRCGRIQELGSYGIGVRNHNVQRTEIKEYAAKILIQATEADDKLDEALEVYRSHHNGVKKNG